MNYGISILFRAIPLLMAAVCFGYGGYIFSAGGDAARLTAGPVIFFLGSICLALYATAATIIRQLIHTYNNTVKYLLPIMGYAVALCTFIFGLVMFVRQGDASFFVSGHVVCGLGLIAMCVSTAATASTGFRLIPENSASREGSGPNPAGFSSAEVSVLVGFTIFVALVAWVWAAVLLSHGRFAPHFVAGCVMGGIACVCTSLVALVASIARQVRGVYTRREKGLWIWLVLGMGCLAFAGGLAVIIAAWGRNVDFVGFVLIGLGLISFSISSKVILLAKTWRADCPLASRIPIIPVATALTCLFMAAFLFEEALFKTKFFVPSRVLVGFGAICFTLYSIVSILESGTSKAK